MPPGLCLTSYTPARTGRPVRTLSRISSTSRLSAAASRGAASTWRRTASKRNARSAEPAQNRARVRAWCSQVQAVLLPRPTW